MDDEARRLAGIVPTGVERCNVCELPLICPVCEKCRGCKLRLRFPTGKSRSQNDRYP